MRPWLLPLLCAPLMATGACADYEYRYLEGEALSRGETEGLRAESFTSWMGHPSGGQVAVFGRPAGGFLECDMEGLQENGYTIRVRCLALPTTKRHVLWDGRELGLIAHDQASTSLCWDLIDEPEGTMKPEAVQAAADLIRRLDPNHFVWVNLCQYPPASDYLASQDLWSYDSYPSPQMTPFDYKRRWLDITDRDLLGKRPLGTCLQTCNSNRHTQRMPTPDELRTTLWLHVIHGYKWFGYYSYYDGEPAGCLSRDAALLSYARALNTEMVQLQDVILAPGQWRDVPLTPATDKLEAREKAVGGKLYVVVVSDSREIGRAHV